MLSKNPSIDPGLILNSRVTYRNYSFLISFISKKYDAIVRKCATKKLLDESFLVHVLPNLGVFAYSTQLRDISGSQKRPSFVRMYRNWAHALAGNRTSCMDLEGV